MYTIRKTLLHHGFLLASTKGVSAGDQGDRDADSRLHGFLLASAKGVGAGDRDADSRTMASSSPPRRASTILIIFTRILYYEQMKIAYPAMA